MRAKLYEKHYKKGLNHFMFKNVIGLSKPDKKVKRFYYALIVAIVVIGILAF